MADDTTRIINLTEATEVSDGMYLVTDASTGTRKLLLQKLINFISQNYAEAYDSTSTYAVGDFCTYNGILYECTTAITTAEAWNSAHWTEATVSEKIIALRDDIIALQEGKANISGTYKDFVAGLADQLNSTQSVINQVPYNFRSTGGTSDVGDREWIKLVGASANINQLVPDTGSSLSVTVPNGHKYYMDKGGTKSIGTSDGTAITGLTGGTDIIVDLTAYFGSSTIPDYIYSLEQATAGSGIAWLRTYFPQLLEYHAYSVLTMKHVTGLTGHVMTGVNQWDEEWEVGDYKASDGTPYASDRVRSKKENYIRVLPNTEYYLKTANVHMTVYYYDADKNYLGNDTKKDTTITTPVNCSYIRFSLATTYGTVYHNDICINLHWSGTMDGTYHPYESHSYPLDSDVVLRGIYKLDANNEPYADGDVWSSEGTLDRNYGLTTWDGTESTTDFTEDSGAYGKRYRKQYSDALHTQSRVPIVCNRGVYAEYGNDVGTAFLNGGWIYYYPPSTVESTTDFLTWLQSNNLTFVYPLATPTTETAPSFTSPQICNDWGTEEFTGTCEIPVGTVSEYPQNLRDKLQHLPSMAESDGDYIIHQDGTEMTLVPSRAPTLPTEDGTYVLKCTVTSGTAVTAWVSEE